MVKQAVRAALVRVAKQKMERGERLTLAEQRALGPHKQRALEGNSSKIVQDYFSKYRERDMVTKFAIEAEVKEGLLDHGLSPQKAEIVMNSRKCSALLSAVEKPKDIELTARHLYMDASRIIEEHKKQRQPLK